MSSPLGNLSLSEIEKLREALIQHDRTQKPFDINNPPPTNYRHQEFPRLVYKHGSTKTPFKTVANEDELEKAIAAGFTKDPPVEVHPEDVELSEALQQEVDQAQAQLAEARKRGKKSQAVAE